MMRASTISEGLSNAPDHNTLRQFVLKGHKATCFLRRATLLRMSLYFLSTACSICHAEFWNELHPSNDAYMGTEQERLQAVAILANNINTDLRYMATNRPAYRQLQRSIGQLRQWSVSPTFLCELADCLTQKRHLVLFESDCYAPNIWSLSVLVDGNGPTRLDQATLFDVVSDDCVLETFSTTNCFGSATNDVLRIRSLAGSGRRGIWTNDTYFALVNSNMLFIRSEHNGKHRSRYPYYLEEYGNISSKKLDALISDPESNFQKAAPPLVLNQLAHLNQQPPSNETGQTLKAIQAAEWMQCRVEQMLKHPHPWVREAANDYLVHFGYYEGQKNAQTTTNGEQSQ